MIKVSVLCSAYNEVENVEELFKTFDIFNKKQGNEWEIVFVDDGSRDGTYKKALEVAKGFQNIKILKHKRNLGKTAGILTAKENSEGDILVIYDADMQYSFDDCLKLVKRIEEEDYDICTGWKQGKYKKAFISKIYNFLSRKFFKLPIHDQNGLKALKRDVLDAIHLRKDWHRYIVSLAIEKGFSVTEEKVTLYPRKYGESKYSGSFRIIIGLFDLLTVKFLTTFLKKPMILFGISGGIFIILGFLTGLTAFILRFFYGFGFRPLLYLVILLILSGLLMFILGFVSELISIIIEDIEELKKKL
uniref:Glycosyltransferase family 2 protein n=1 Tax=candidate division WOR-3 bacterium TaxID=2052148 RepID=A0A7C3J5J1_UNCW3